MRIPYCAGAKPPIETALAAAQHAVLVRKATGRAPNTATNHNHEELSGSPPYGSPTLRLPRSCRSCWMLDPNTLRTPWHSSGKGAMPHIVGKALSIYWTSTPYTGSSDGCAVGVEEEEQPHCSFYGGQCDCLPWPGSSAFQTFQQVRPVRATVLRSEG